MARIISFEERRRQSRNIVFTAFFILILLYTYKLSYPQKTILTFISSASGPNHNRPAAGGILHSTSTSKKLAPTSHAPATTAQARPGAPNSTETADKQLIPMRNAAVLISPFFRANLVPLVVHFAGILGTGWPIVIYTSAKALDSFSGTPALARHISTGAVRLRVIPPTLLVAGSDERTIESLVTVRWFWETLEPAEYVLMFQSDSMLCANSINRIEKYTHFDFVGLSIDGESVGGGGLTLRKRQSMLEVLIRFQWKKDVDPVEDMWFFDRLHVLEKEQELAPHTNVPKAPIHLPAPELSRTFVITGETPVDREIVRPLGVENVMNWSSELRRGLAEWCPEYILCSAVGSDGNNTT